MHPQIIKIEVNKRRYLKRSNKASGFKKYQIDTLFDGRTKEEVRKILKSCIIEIRSEDIDITTMDGEPKEKTIVTRSCYINGVLCDYSLIQKIYLHE